ncbi:23S ribosomal RNA methyltransferase Erm [Candidatus Woesebacteria bacterium]|nr:23S ribosomal RNA methyltransferase Erm [Candidatus Woesebacteria bacterium]
MSNFLPNDRKISHSQNFLKNPEFVKSLIHQTDINNGDLVVEIGPGKGIITGFLKDVAANVIGIEVDKQLFDNLKSKFNGFPSVNIINTDFLQWNLPLSPYKVFSNIPFNMTTDIVTKLLNSRNSPVISYLIMQDKAAERFLGDPYGKNTQMSILVNPYYETSIVTKINRNQFSPVPNIDAVLVRFQKRNNPLVKPEHSQLFRDFVVYGYNQWKPTVLESFEKIFSPKQRSILQSTLHIQRAKPSDLNLEQWLALFDSFNKYTDESKKKIVSGAENKLKIQQSKLQKLHRTR